MNVRLPLLSGALLLAFQSTAYCFDSGRTALDLLANDKDEQSIVVRAVDIKNANQAFQGIEAAKPRLQIIAQGLAHSLFEEDVTCEPEVLKNLADLNEMQGIDRSPLSIRHTLVALRSLDMIDDLVLLPLLVALPIYTGLNEMPHTKSSGICETDDYLMQVDRLKNKLGRKYRRKNILAVMPDSRSLYYAHFEKTPFTLSRVVRSIKVLKNSEAKKSEATAYSSKIRKKSGGLSNRMMIYKNFDSFELGLLSNIQKRFNRRILPTTRLEVRAIYEDGTIAGSEPEIETRTIVGEDKMYRMAASWLYADIQEAQKRGTIFAGKKIEVDDVIMAALETGVVQGSQVNQVLKVSEIWNPKTSAFKKVLAVVQKYGGPALIFAPPPFNMISSTVITLLQTKLFQSKGATEPDYLRVSPF